MPKTFIIKQLHTFEHYYEIEAETAEEALFKLQTEFNVPVLEEFHHMNDRQDWEISLDESGAKV
jgi:hypothetical protein